jgi:transcriptional regulator with XRE-family HTH domain
MDKLIQESQNRYLHRVRIEKGLSLKQLAKIAKMSRWTIFNLEYGYIYFTDRRIDRLSNALGVDKEEFYNRSRVPDTIKEVDEHKFYKLMEKILLKKITLVISIVVLILSIAVSVIFGSLFFGIGQTKEYEIGQDLITIRENVLQQGDFVSINIREPIAMIASQDFYCLEGKITDEIVSSSTEIYFSEKNTVIYTFYSEINDTSSEFSKITFKYSFDEYIYHFYLEDSTYELIYTVDSKTFSRNYSSLSYYSTLDETVWTIYDTNKEIYTKFINIVETKKDNYLLGIKNLISPMLDDETIDVENFLAIQKGEEKRLSNMVSSWAFLYIIGITFGVISVVSLIAIVCFYNAHKYKMENIESYKEEKRTFKIQNNFKLGPPLKESFLRTIGVIIIFIANLCLYFYIAKYLGFVDINSENFFIKYASEIKGLAALGQILVLTVSLKIFTTGDNLVIKALVFLLLGIIYYLVVIVLIWSELGTSIVLDILVPYLPSNIFWSIAVFAFTAVFLFVTPTKCDKKWKRIIWRSQIIWPIVYVVIGSILKYLFRTGSIYFHESLLFLLPNKPLLVTIYGEFLIIAIYIFERIIVFRHDEEYLVEYRNTNQYFWIFNIICCFLIALVAVLENCVSFKGQSIFSWGKMKLVWLLIPLIFIYHPRITKPKIWQIGLYGTGLFVASMIGIFLITIGFMTA